MEIPAIEWDSYDDVDSNVRAVLENGITLDEVRDLFADRDLLVLPNRGGEPFIAHGRTSTGRRLAVAWERWTGEPWAIRPIWARLIQ